MQEQNATTEAAASSAFDRFVDLADIDLQHLDEDDNKAFQSAKSRVLRALKQGRLTIHDDGKAEFRPATGEAVNFARPTGATRLAAERGDNANEKAILALAHLAGTKKATFENMEHKDLRVCEAFLSLWLSS